jgi:mono/diheme cytochrome c family protein
MRQLINPVLSLIAILLAVSVWVYQFTTGPSFIPGPAAKTGETELYQPTLEHDPTVPGPPADAVGDFNTFLGRLREASKSSVSSLVLHADGLDRAEQVFRGSVGVPDDVMIEMHSPFFTVDPEAIIALYADLPTLERGLGLYQQHCNQCHGPYGRGNGAATQQWYVGNFPRNFWYGRFKSRSTEYGTMPTDGDLFRTLTRGLYGSTMPPFRHLSTQDRWTLVQLVKSLANFYDDYDEAVVNRFDTQFASSELIDFGDAPPATLHSVTRGRVLFIEQGCVSCHQGSKSKPVGLARWEGSFSNWTDEMNRPIQNSRDLTTSVFLSGAAPSDLFRIISGGPNVGPMPNYLNIPQEDRWALVHYIQSVFKPDFPQAPPSADALAKRPNGEVMRQGKDKDSE